jgi:hypothetical protein
MTYGNRICICRDRIAPFTVGTVEVRRGVLEKQRSESEIGSLRLGQDLRPHVS